MSARSLQPGLRTAESEPTRIQVIELDRDHAVGVAFNMLFMIWRFNTQVSAVKAACRLLSDLANRHPEGLGICHLVESEAIPPSTLARKLIAELMSQPSVRHYSVTQEGSGFKAASIRAVIAGIHGLSRATCQHSVHNTFARAAEWHASRQTTLGRSETAAQINAALEALRTQHRQRYA